MSHKVEARALPPVMRYHGGKHRIADWIIGQFPPHSVYVEPFGGAGSVLVRKEPARSEVYNDLDSETANVFQVLRDPASADRLRTLCELTPYARAEFDLAQIRSDEPVEQARRTLFRAWASFGSAGATRGRSGMRTYTRPDGDHLNVAKSWNRVADMIPHYVERMRRVVIENRPALDIMRQHDSRETLHYVDPPYLPETRSQGSHRYYRHEMTVDDHVALLESLRDLKGMVLLSGYESTLYDEKLPGWRRLTLSTTGSSRMGSVQRLECLWVSPAAARARDRFEQQADMFGGAA